MRLLSRLAIGLFEPLVSQIDPLRRSRYPPIHEDC